MCVTFQLFASFVIISMQLLQYAIYITTTKNSYNGFLS